MGALLDGLLATWHLICNFFKLLFWFWEGLFKFGEMLTTGFVVVIDLFDFFPHAVVVSLVSCCSVLLILRLLGRS